MRHLDIVSAGRLLRRIFGSGDVMPMRILAVSLLALVLASPSVAQEDLRATLFAQADAARSAAFEAEAERLAPAAFERGREAYAAAEEDFERGRNMERIRNRLADATQAFNAAAEAASIAKI